MDYKKTNAPQTTTVNDLIELAKPTGNIYESIKIGRASCRERV